MLSFVYQARSILVETGPGTEDVRARRIQSGAPFAVFSQIDANLIVLLLV
jgi:hypothetical protein